MKSFLKYLLNYKYISGQIKQLEYNTRNLYLERDPWKIGLTRGAIEELNNLL